VEETPPGGSPPGPQPEETGATSSPLHRRTGVRVRKKRRVYEFDFEGRRVSWIVYVAAVVLALLVAWLLVREMNRPTGRTEGRSNYRRAVAVAARAVASPGTSASVT
jgi:hypothetical protein